MTPPAPVTVLVADDHPLVLRGISDLLRAEPDLRIVAECMNGTEALEMIAAARPAIAVLDLSMPGLSGLDILKRVEGERLACDVIILTASISDTKLLDAVATGASGILLKDTAPDLLVRAVAARGLARYLERAAAPVRSSIESTWATAKAPEERATLARALGIASPDWLTDLALSELAADPSPLVRRAALDAARAQLDKNPASYVQLAAARSSDPDRSVRKVARHLLRRAEASDALQSLRPPPRARRESQKRLRQALREPRLRSRSNRPNLPALPSLPTLPSLPSPAAS